MLEVALVGLPGSGKSTLFRLLTGLAPSTRPEPVKGVADVPDPRLAALAKIFRPRKVTPAQIAFVDVPGVSPGSAAGASRRFLADIRDVDALVHVLPAFDAEHDPLEAALALDLELTVADLEAVERRLERLRQQKRRPTDAAERAALERLREALGEGRPAAAVPLSAEEERLIAGFGLLTKKPILYVLNVAGELEAAPAFRREADARGWHVLLMSAALEAEIAELPEEARGEFLADLGVAEPGIDRLCRSAYERLGLISFLTAGEDEVRAWPIPRGTTAREAAGKIHSDIARGFIRAEVVAFDDLVAAGSLARARELGTWRLEGRDYVVQDGDVITFRFNAP
jgi:GTP-binding protein YchF